MHFQGHKVPFWSHTKQLRDRYNVCSHDSDLKMDPAILMTCSLEHDSDDNKRQRRQQQQVNDYDDDGDDDD